MPKIDLSYNWGPENSPPPAADGLKPRPLAMLRNPLMDLLQAVREHGSIAAAARSLGLSYRHVWGELKKWELRLDQNLIVWEKGMPAELSEFASKLLWAERQAQARLAAPIESLMAELERTFSVAFDPSAHLVSLYASHDDALVRLRELCARDALYLDLRFCGSVDAIRALNEGRCEIAGFHTRSSPHPESLTAHTFKPLLKPGRHKLIAFARRTQGLLVRKGNPLQIQQIRDVVQRKARFVNRDLGTGTRLLLDDLLKEDRISSVDINGYLTTEPSHAAVATAIASGRADTGVAIESAAQAAGLDFVPIATERYWLACLKSALDSPALVALRETLMSQGWHQALDGMLGYEFDQTGQVQSLSRELPWWKLQPRRESVKQTNKLN